ncbi:short-chain dehydrogenase reductase 3b [Amborella trichopoda]|nr:short-chain dehydrogenase reductase 3b [Amborella trichopoda]|eukprot:XP_006841570.2 short-chain dehydrogenase reductase 3b [Amborella trichopoda]
MSKMRLEGKVAIITGAASGIGEAAARLFVENGARVVIADIQDELGIQVATSIGLEQCSYKHCDVRDENQIRETVRFALEKYGKVDVMFSNAGVLGHQTSILDMDAKEFDETLSINLRGMTLAVKHAACAMVEKGTCGSIICTASVSACIGGVAAHSYTISKHAVVGLVRSASSDLGRHGIRVNCISPYGMATPSVCKAYNSTPDEIEADCNYRSTLKGVTLKPKQIAEAALFLASDESSFVSGHNLVVDGGFTVVDHSAPSNK